MKITWKSNNFNVVILVSFILSLLIARPLEAYEHQIVPSVIDNRQETADARWVPWLGCWQSLDDQFGALKASRDNQPEPNTAVANGVKDGSLVCLSPAKHDEGIELEILVGNRSFLKKTIRADGLRHRIEESECSGWQSSEWSSNGYRFFTKAELDCEDLSHRSVSGISFMKSPSIWVDVQVVETGGHQALTVHRYRPVSKQGTTDSSTSLPRSGNIHRLYHRRYASRTAIATPFTVPEILEASEKLPTEGLKTALIETNTTFDLSSKTLVELDEAGVPESIIDLMVASSFPNAFVVDHYQVSNDVPFRTRSDRYFGAYGYLPYDIWYPHYLTPFGYSYGWGPYHPLYVGWGHNSHLFWHNNRVGRLPNRSVRGRGYRQRQHVESANSTSRVIHGKGYMSIRRRGATSAVGGTIQRRGTSSPNVPTVSPRSNSTGRSSGAGMAGRGYSKGGTASGRGAKARRR